MDAAKLMEVCRLCPGNNTKLISVFDEQFLGKNIMKEAILVTTGIEVQENDEISVKICDRCSKITLQMFKFRQDAILHDKLLRERRNQQIEDQEIRLPNIDVRNKRETPSTSSAKNSKRPLEVHHSITQMYKAFPSLKLPKNCINTDMSPFVSLTIGEVEKYFEQRKLNINQSPATSIKSPSNRVAKMIVNLPTQGKKTSLRINKKLCISHENSNKTSDSYFCTTNRVQKRKRCSACDSGVKAKLSRESNTGCSNNITEDPVTPLRVTIPLVKHTTPAVDQSEDSVTTNKSTATSSSSNSAAYQHVHFECFGLTPTVTTTKSRTQLVCHLCSSVHKNPSRLKRHTIKHMVCHFCKRRFKSLDSKDRHVNNSCKIRIEMNSSGPEVHLNKIDLDLEIRKKYMDAFTTFEPIPGLMESEEVPVSAVSPRQTLHQDKIIVFSDDDDGTVSGTSTATKIMSSVNTISYPNPEPTLINSSIVKPDINLKTDDISEFFGNNNEKEVTKGLLSRCKAGKMTVEKMIQTDMPASEDIQIKSNRSCEFKNLKDYMVPFKVPIHLINGPFNVAYKFDNPPESDNKSGAWHSLPIVDVKKNSQAVVAYSKPVASSSAPIQQPVSPKNNNPQPSTSQSNNVQDVNSPTPIRQAYLDTAPNVPRKSPPVPNNLPENSSSALKGRLEANTPVRQSLNKHIDSKNSVNTSIGQVVLNNPTNNTTNQLAPNIMLGEILDRTASCASRNMSEGIASNMKNLLSNIPQSNSPVKKLKNCIPHPRVSTNQVSMNNTTIATNSTNHVQNNVVPMSNDRTQMDSTTALINNVTIIQNIPADSSSNQQKNGILPPLATSNTQTNVYTAPLTMPNTQGNLNPPPSRLLSAKTNASLLLIPNKQMNVNPTVLTKQNNTQKNASYFRSTMQNTQKNAYPPSSAMRNTLKNVNPHSSATPNTQRNINSPALAMRNTQMSVNSPSLATQRNVSPLAPPRNALLMPNTQRNSTYSVECAIRVKNISELR